MKNENNNSCDGCGKTTLLQKYQENEFCTICIHIAEVLKNDPQCVQKIGTLIQSDFDNEKTDSVCNTDRIQGLPDVVDAVRHRTRDRELNTWYVSVSEMEGNPVEIFASTAFDRDQHLQSRISNLTTITRLISLILRHIFLGEVLNLDKTIKQLHRSSRQKNDLPDMLTGILRRYSTPVPKSSDDIPE